MPKNIFFKTFSIQKATNQTALPFPTTNSIGDAMVVGIWVRRSGTIAETGGTISTDTVKNGHLTLVSNGITMFDPLPVDIIASTNELTGSFFPIDLNNIDWLKTKVDTNNRDAAAIEFIFKYVK
jgi:hypothetical protein